MNTNFYVYMLANRPNGVLFVDMASDLAGRVAEHREDRLAGFTRDHGVHTLVWFEGCTDAEDARLRRKRIRRWRRSHKLRLVQTANPEWQDLYPTLLRLDRSVRVG